MYGLTVVHAGLEPGVKYIPNCDVFLVVIAVNVMLALHLVCAVVGDYNFQCVLCRTTVLISFFT